MSARTRLNFVLVGHRARGATTEFRKIFARKLVLRAPFTFL
jgi:hypothetical protein